MHLIYNNDIYTLRQEIEIIKNSSLRAVQHQYNCDTKNEIIALIEDEIEMLERMNEEYMTENYQDEDYYHYLN